MASIKALFPPRSTPRVPHHLTRLIPFLPPYPPFCHGLPPSLCLRRAHKHGGLHLPPRRMHQLLQAPLHLFPPKKNSYGSKRKPPWGKSSGKKQLGKRGDERERQFSVGRGRGAHRHPSLETDGHDKEG